MIPLGGIQREVKEWSLVNFGNHSSIESLLGLQEEVGELSHAYLKRKQGIRGTQEEHNIAIKDAVGDLCIYLMDFCNEEGLNIEDVIIDTWKMVSKRDWIKFPIDGWSK